MNEAASIEYVYPESVEGAVGLLAAYRGEARIVAGGTDVLPDLRSGKIGPRCLVDITRIPELGRITVYPGWVEVGAAVTFADLRASDFVRDRVHALADAARSVGARAIQNAATWTGNLVQAMPAADGAMIALALDAEARLADQARAVWLPVEELFVGPGQSAVDPTRQMITHLRFPIPEGRPVDPGAGAGPAPRWQPQQSWGPQRNWGPQARWGTAFARIGRRPSLVLPILNCAVSLVLEAGDGRIAAARVALGPVAPRPVRARRAESYLVGHPPSAVVLVEAAELARQEAEPRDSVMRASRDYRLAVIPPLVERALATAAERAGA